MDDGDHEDANEDSNDRGHHVVHSCSHPHPACCLIIQGRHTWKTGGTALSSPISTPPPTRPSISSSFLIPPAQQASHQASPPSAPPSPAPTPPSFDPLIPLQPHSIFHVHLAPHPSSQAPHHQPSLFNPHPVLRLYLCCTMTSLSFHSSSCYGPQDYTSLQLTSLYTTCKRYFFWCPIQMPFTSLMHLSSFSCCVCELLTVCAAPFS